jgi:hypothetical protein
MPLGNNLYRVQTVQVTRREILHVAVLAGAGLANRVEDGGLRGEKPGAR